MKNKIMMIFYTFVIIITKTIYDIFLVILFIIFFIPILFLPFENFSRILEKMHKGI